MIAQAPPKKTCPKCWRHLPRDEFRFLNKAQNKRASECKRCRNRRLRKQRREARHLAVKRACTEIRRAETAEKVLLIVNALIDRLGGPDQFIGEMVGLIKDDSIPVATRTKAIETVVCMAVMADVHESQVFESIDPIEYFLWLNEQKKLVPLVRACLEDGLFTLDDIDPAPTE